MNKDLVFIVSGGRTGTAFFANHMGTVVEDCIAVHDPDTVVANWRSNWHKMRSFGVYNLSLGRLLGRTGARGLSLRHLSGSSSADRLVTEIRRHRERFYDRLEAPLVVESHGPWYGVADLLPRAFPGCKIIGLLRDPRDWVLSWVNHGGRYGDRDMARRFGGRRLEPAMIGDGEWAGRWPKMTPFEKLCWEWRLQCRLLARAAEKNPQARLFTFESLFVAEDRADTVRRMLDFLTDFPHRRYAYSFDPTVLDRPVHGSKHRLMGPWPSWSPDQARFLDGLCGEAMVEYGYGGEPEWRSLLEKKDHARARVPMPLPATSPPRFATLILLSGLSILTLNMFVPSLTSIARHFSVDYAVVNLSVAGYAAMTALLQLVMGPLSDRFGRRPVILAGLVLFVLASLGCVLADDIGTFLFFRLLQAAIASGHAVSMAVIRDTAPTQKAASLMGYLAMAWAVAPMLGPLFGGTLDEFFGWRANFWAFLVFGLAVFALCWIDLGETNQQKSETFAKQFREYPELLRARRFWGYALCSAFSIGTFFAYLGGAPLVATQVFQMSPAMVGVTVGIITAGFMTGSFLSGRFAARHRLTTMMITGRLVACVGLSAGLALTLVGVVNEATVFGAALLAGLGNGLTNPSSHAGALSVRPRLAGSAAGLSSALIVALGAAVSGLTGTVVGGAHAASVLLAVMLASALIGLAAALAVRRLER